MTKISVTLEYPKIKISEKSYKVTETRRYYFEHFLPKWHGRIGFKISKQFKDIKKKGFYKIQERVIDPIINT